MLYHKRPRFVAWMKNEVWIWEFHSSPLDGEMANRGWLQNKLSNRTLELGRSIEVHGTDTQVSIPSLQT